MPVSVSLLWWSLSSVKALFLSLRLMSYSGLGCQGQVSCELQRRKTKQLAISGIPKIRLAYLLTFLMSEESHSYLVTNSFLQVLVNCLRYYLRRPETDEDSY
jgi:hypothetical protein